MPFIPNLYLKKVSWKTFGKRFETFQMFAGCDALAA